MAAAAQDAMNGPGVEPEAPAPGDEVTVKIHGMAHGGEGVGKTAAGRVVFVDGGLPGEDVTARLTDVQPRFARGRMIEVPVLAAPSRVERPGCPHFGRWPGRGRDPSSVCGACQWQHIEYEAQLAFKQQILIDTLVHVGKLADPPVLPAVGMEQPWGYRNQIRLAVRESGVGYRAGDGSTIVPIDLCPIAHPLVMELLPLVVDAVPAGWEVTLRAGIRTGDQLVVLHAASDDVDAIEVEADVAVALERPDGRVDAVSGAPLITEVLGDEPFIVPATSFFQVNTLMAESLVEAVRAGLPDDLGVLVDVHSGVGTFAILLADMAAEVYAIERDADAVAAAVENAEGLAHLTFLEADAAEGLNHLGLRPDAVIVDPPRAGLDREVMRLLTNLAPDTIAYVSCEPSTLARDARHLVASGYRLDSSQLVDMFPQTFHVESVNVFRRS